MRQMSADSADSALKAGKEGARAHVGWRHSVTGARLVAAVGIILAAACATSGGGGAPTHAGPALARADSALVGRILLAEDRRDLTDPALAEGRAHSHPVIRTLAVRATGRIHDPGFRTRDSLPPLPAPPAW